MFVQAWGILFFKLARNAGDGTPIRFSLPELNRDGLSLVRQSSPCYRDSDWRKGYPSTGSSVVSWRLMQ